MNLRHETPRCGFEVFVPTDDPVLTAKDFEELVNVHLPGASFMAPDPDLPAPPTPERPFLTYYRFARPFGNEPGPGEGHLKSFGRGIGDPEKRQFASTGWSHYVLLRGKTDDAVSSYRKVCQLALEAAERVNGLLYDSETREYFSREEWRKRRLDNWSTNGVPNMIEHVVVSVAQPAPPSPMLRSITHGMRKLGLPDLVVEGLPRSHSGTVSALLQLTAQAMAEQSEAPDPDDYSLNLKEVRDPQVREQTKSWFGENGSGRVRLSLYDGKPRQNDPDNQLLELAFDHGNGRTHAEKLSDMLSQAFGSRDNLTDVEPSEAIDAASARAKKKLAEMKSAFRKGLPGNARLLVKGPFRHKDGTEWMWMELAEWTEDDDLRGLLENDPVNVDYLRAGSNVTFHLDKAFDYILIHPDGTREGNETGKLIDAQK